MSWSWPAKTELCLSQKGLYPTTKQGEAKRFFRSVANFIVTHVSRTETETVYWCAFVCKRLQIHRHFKSLPNSNWIITNNLPLHPFYKGWNDPATVVLSYSVHSLFKTTLTAGFDNSCLGLTWNTLPYLGAVELHQLKSKHLCVFINSTDYVAIWDYVMGFNTHKISFAVYVNMIELLQCHVLTLIYLNLPESPRYNNCSTTVLYISIQMVIAKTNNFCLEVCTKYHNRESIVYTLVMMLRTEQNLATF
jgi:hypothetical protein